jgi:hypothetical protein
VNAARLQQGQAAAVCEKFDVGRRDVSNDIESIINHSNAGQAFITHHLESIG